MFLEIASNFQIENGIGVVLIVLIYWSYYQNYNQSFFKDLILCQLGLKPLE